MSLCKSTVSWNSEDKASCGAPSCWPPFRHSILLLHKLLSVRWSIIQKGLETSICVFQSFSNSRADWTVLNPQEKSRNMIQCCLLCPNWRGFIEPGRTMNKNQRPCSTSLSRPTLSSSNFVIPKDVCIVKCFESLRKSYTRLLLYYYYFMMHSFIIHSFNQPFILSSIYFIIHTFYHLFIILSTHIISIHFIIHSFFSHSFILH